MSGIIINGKRYVLKKEDLLCEAVVSSTRNIVDFNSKTKYLYYPKGMAFILKTVYDLAGDDEYKVLGRKEALAFMDKYPSGIKESVYKRYFGEPEEV